MMDIAMLGAEVGPSIDGFHQPNWSVEHDMDCVEFGWRVGRALDEELVTGWSALWDLSYENYLRERGEL